MNTAGFLDASLCVRFILTLGHFLWQGVAVFVIAAIVLRVLRHASAHARYVASVVAFGLMAACPPATFLMVNGSLAMVETETVQSIPQVVRNQPPAPALATGGGNMTQAQTQQPTPHSRKQSVPTIETPAAVQAAEPRSVLDWQRYAPYAVFCYLIGAIVMFGRLLLGVHGGRQLRRQSLELDDAGVLGASARQARAMGLRFTPMIAYCRRVAVPTVVGVIRPMILLPLSAASGLDREQLEMLLAHELAHIRRHDHLANFLQRVIEAMLFFHPAVWLLSRRIRIEREHCCDDRVVAVGGRRFAYAESLVRMAELSVGARLQASGLASRYAAVAALAADGHGSNFHARIARLVAGTTPDRLRLRRTWTLAMPLLLLAVLAIVRTVPADPATASKPARADATAEYALSGRVVDEQGHPVSGVSVSLLPSRPQPAEAITDSSGQFVLRHDRPTLRYTTLFASTKDGTRQGLMDFEADLVNPTTVKPIDIVVKPARTITVEVANAAGKPVENASIEVFHSYQPLYAARTGEDGLARIRVAADLNARWVVALKSGTGFDYFENYSTWPPPRWDVPEPLPDKIKLVLDGAQQVRVRAVDSAGKPLPNVWFNPWTIRKPGKISDVNLSGSVERTRSAGARTDASGVAVFDWISAALVGGVTFLDRSESSYCMESPHWAGPESGPEATAKLFRNAHLSGKVFLPDGKPAADVLLQAEGRGATNHYCRRQVRTRADGSYSVDLSAKQSYIIAVIDETWAAPSRIGLFLEESENCTDVDFRLAKGTLFHGTVTMGPQNTPAAGETVTLEEVGQRLPPQDSYRGGDRESLIRWATTDENGHYAVRVGPGEFNVWALNNEKIRISVDEEEEIVEDFHGEAPSTKHFSGKVVDSNDGRLIAGAMLYAAPTSRDTGRWGFRGVTNQQGHFEANWCHQAIVVCACDDKGQRAGWAVASADATQVTVQAKPAARAVGRVVDRDGKPLPNQSVVFVFSITTEEDETVDFGLSRGQTVTAADGTFTIGAIPVGVRCSILLLVEADEEVSKLLGRNRSMSWSQVHEFEADSATVIQIPDLTPVSRKPTTRPH